MVDSPDTLTFSYAPDSSLEVIIITNAANDHDGYLEVNGAARLLAPLLQKSASGLWTGAAPSHKLTRNNKNFLHVFGLFKYLQSYNLNASAHPPQYYTVKAIICDLLMGVQTKTFDPLCEIKTQLCAIQESLNEAIVIINNHASAEPPFAPPNTEARELAELLHSEYSKKLTFATDTILDNVKSIKDLVCLNK
ncbi:viral capsid protein [Anticarsia gemmatalis multiple nucleopolyhedrovirus]|uniref:Viral capsid protein n=2 Tax=Alphabaculovirus TaxID=558016 RepID=A0A0S3IVM2_9ABAC|nr:viral capsid protein [Anticarsia gemmatalis multiple nucleopolyhedrovirus]YP_803519.1 viral capsid protein [Anticarsia gemmatalis nucleopolyhedrovirus]AAS83211.1 capsid protein [Anticarsia gemmatalis nucleopolyhedrovirus]ABI13908.1 viral capsid protein [Anticarsia gemmatalis multiple nucleopolyhedrovirus]ALR69840.1 viral capsid protein [Anticarsia gemmatalis multiple nucleopolyhedrovirus]ALR69998.1 viral capsid protein [Anticarsia gemmatalis multiple nucleopolyhedrovirus]ALR70155.1 viral c